MAQKIILAYSGGLDTTYCLLYLKKQGYKVITTTIDTGGFSSQELRDIEARAYKLGSTKHITIDGRDKIWKYGTYIIKGEHLRGGVYPICVAPERCAIVPSLVDIAKKYATNVIAHGSTGAGGDQVRFDNALNALMPDVEMVTPIREQGLSRQQTSDILKEWGHPVSDTIKDYSVNIGLLGTSIGGKETLNTLETLPDTAFPGVVPLEKTPDTPAIIKISFNEGIPEGGVSLLQELNILGAKHGYGKNYHVGTSLLGVPARLGFEAPGMLSLIEAHTNLAKVVLTKEERLFLQNTGNLWGELIHSGRFYHPIEKVYCTALDAVNKCLTGEVTIQFYKGHLSVLSVESKISRFGNSGPKYGEEIDIDGKALAQMCRLFDAEGIAVAQHRKKQEV